VAVKTLDSTLKGHTEALFVASCATYGHGRL
jgi:hypothetical protein